MFFYIKHFLYRIDKKKNNDKIVIYYLYICEKTTKTTKISILFGVFGI